MGSADGVRVLLALGADPNATNGNGQKPVDRATTQEIKDVLAATAVDQLIAAVAAMPLTSSLPAMEEWEFRQAAGDGDLAKVQLAVETHKLDPNCTDVSAPSLSVSRTTFHLRPLIALCHRCACACVASLRAMA